MRDFFCCLYRFPHSDVYLNCKTVGFVFSKSFQSRVTQEQRESARRACEAREKKPTVSFPYNELVLTWGSKMSSSCQKSLYNSSLFVNLIHLVIGFAKEQCMLLFMLGFTYVSVNSCCAHPFLGYCGAFARPVTPGGGYLPTPGATPKLLTCTWFCT